MLFAAAVLSRVVKKVGFKLVYYKSTEKVVLKLPPLPAHAAAGARATAAAAGARAPRCWCWCPRPALLVLVPAPRAAGAGARAPRCWCWCWCPRRHRWSSSWLVVIAVVIVGRRHGRWSWSVVGGHRWLPLSLSLSSLSVAVIVSQPSVIIVVDVGHRRDCDRHATIRGCCTPPMLPLGPLFSLG